MSDDQLRRAAERGRRMAEMAEGEDGLLAVFDAVERNYVETLIGTAIEDKHVREQSYHRINSLRDIRRAIEIVVAEGAGAEAAIAKLSRTQ
ncbi:MAG: hypothetical protein IT537_25300 [Hyphomicrobiales bacterium]|nr:hypothetical protein [Hyphomicrobiales bacterium]